MTSVFQDQLVAAGYTTCWMHGEPSGTSCVDFIGAVNATYAGGVTLAQPGFVAGFTSALFDGVDDQASAADNAAFDLGTGDFTLSGIIQVASLSGSTFTIMGHDGNGGAGDWQLRLINGLFSCRFAGGNAYQSASQISVGVPHRWCFSADRNGNGLFIIDGVLDATRDISADVATSLTDASTLYIGRRLSAQWFPGYMQANAIAKGVATSLATEQAINASLQSVYASGGPAFVGGGFF